MKLRHLPMLLAVLPTLAFAEAAPPQQTPAAQLPSGEYVLDRTHASLTFKVSHMGMSNYTARFTKLDGTLTYDPIDPAKSSIRALIDPTSIKTDYPNPEKVDFDAELAGEKWLNAPKFPAIAFESTSVTRTGDKTGTVTGNLTFMGVTKPVTLNATFNGGYAEKPFSNPPAAGIGFSASTVIKRSDFGFSTYVPMIGDDVTIEIEAEFTKSVDSKAGKV